MGKQKKKYYKPNVPQAAPPPKVELPEADSNTRQLKIIFPIIIAVATFICFHNTLQNQFLNWDDGIYVTQDPYITKLTGTNIKKLLFENVTQNYFHPITMLSLALNYQLSQLKPEGYYLTNILIHTANAIIVFFLACMLFEAMTEKGKYPRIKHIPWLAGIIGLWYGIHPMRVESVAWMAERKDVLYAFFYFLGLIMYVRFIKEPTRKWMIYVVLCYIASLLSKPMAVAFPLSLFAIDILLKRENVKKLFMEKIPFFIVSALGGVLVFFTQKESGSIAFLHGYNVFQKFDIACYGFMMYTSKAFAPVNLCSFYPYPNLYANYTLPGIFYVGPFAAAAIVGIPLYLTYRFARNFFPIVLFGLGFYFANLVFVLQFLSSGMTVMSDRYSYVAYFGLFFLLAWLLYRAWEKVPNFRIPLMLVVAAGTGIWGYLCMERTKVWHDSDTLWSDVIAKFPDRVEKAYLNLAESYTKQGEYEKAYPEYLELVKMQTTAPQVYRNLGNIYAMHKDFDKSLDMYSRSVRLDSTSFDTYLDLGVTYSIMGRFDMALVNYNKAYRLDTNEEKILQNRSYTYFNLKQYPEAIGDYNHLIRINPSNADYFFSRGQAKHNMGNYPGAIDDYQRSLSMKPGNPDCLYDASMAYNSLGQLSQALDYAMKAKQAGFNVPDAYIAQLQKTARKGR